MRRTMPKVVTLQMALTSLKPPLVRGWIISCSKQYFLEEGFLPMERALQITLRNVSASKAPEGEMGDDGSRLDRVPLRFAGSAVAAAIARKHGDQVERFEIAVHGKLASEEIACNGEASPDASMARHVGSGKHRRAICTFGQLPEPANGLHRHGVGAQQRSEGASTRNFQWS
jgi:hypothetical protein